MWFTLNHLHRPQLPLTTKYKAVHFTKKQSAESFQTCKVERLKRFMFRLSKRAHSSNMQRGFSAMTSWESCVYSVISQTCLCRLFHFIFHADSRGRLRSWRSVHIYGLTINKRDKKKKERKKKAEPRRQCDQEMMLDNNLRIHRNSSCSQ